MCISEKKLKMWKEYFPYINFSPFTEQDKNSNDYLSEEIPDKFDEYCKTINGEFFLDIPQMVGKDIFAPLFPASELKEEYADELDKMKKSGKRLNVIEYFIKKEDEQFVAGLNKKLEDEAMIIPRETILEYFLYDHNLTHSEMKSICYYSVKKDNNDESKDEFIWELSNFVFYHSVKSIYDTFHCYAHKNCTLYLFGVDYYKFRQDPSKWFVIDNKGKSQTLPEYFSKYKEKIIGLDEQFNHINAGDFVWKNGSKWDKTESEKHLLEQFRLNINLLISLKDIYHSFSMPLLRKEYCLKTNCLKISDKMRFGVFKQFGWDIIKNTLLWKTDHADGWQIKSYSTAWTEKITYILEGTYKLEGINEKESIYNPTPFEKFIEQAAGQVNYLKEWEIGRTVAEYGPLDSNDCQDIRDYFHEIDKNITFLSKDDQEIFFRISEDEDSTMYDKLKEIYRLIMANKDIKTIFKGRYSTIKALYEKAFPFHIENKWIKDDDEEIQPQYADSKYPKPDEMIIGEELRKQIMGCYPFVIECFLDEFDENDEEDWRHFIRNEDPNKLLFRDLRSYPPRSFGRQPVAKNSDLFKNYCKIMNIDIDDEEITNIHNGFVVKMRNITDRLENKLREAGYWR